MNQLFKSFELNSIEVERAVRTVVPKLWGQIKGNWDPLDNDNPISYGHAQYAVQVDPLLARVVAHYRGQANYSRVSECKQTSTETVPLFVERMRKVFRIHSGVPVDGADNSPYSMQLKNALLIGFRPEISQFVVKHLIGWKNEGLQRTIDYATHAEETIEAKKKEKKSCRYALA